MKPAAPGALNLRTAQKRFIRMVDQHRLLAFLARRQFGKTTTFAAIALKKMMKQRDHTVIFGSAKLNLSREIVRKEAAIIQAAVAGLSGDSRQLQVIDGATGRAPDRLSADDFAGIYEAQRLEMRYYHSPSSYSRTKVVALLPDTVGETGDLMCDEVGRVKNFLEVWEAIEPIVQSNPQFRLLLSTTPPPDDAHFSFDMLAWPVGTEFPVSQDGNVYRSEMGVTVLRVDAFDAWADGVPVYDLEDGKPLQPSEHRRRAHNKDAWDRNYGVKFVLGGTSAVGLMQLDVAQKRGIGQCALFLIENDSDLEAALKHLAAQLGSGKVGIGFDVATTTKQLSNPSCLAVAEAVGIETRFPAVLVWKTKDPDVAMERVRRVVAAVARRPDGGRARKLCVDGTNERYFASTLTRSLGDLIGCDVVVGSETVERPGYEPMTTKQFLGGQLIAELDDNHLTLPAERYLRDDWRLVKNERGALVCEPDGDGRHGDTFDGCKLALEAVRGKRGGFFAPFARPGTRSAVAASRRNRTVFA